MNHILVRVHVLIYLELGIYNFPIEILQSKFKRVRSTEVKCVQDSKCIYTSILKVHVPPEMLSTHTKVYLLFINNQISKSRKKNSHTIYNTDKTGEIDLFSILYIVHINFKFYPNSM